MPLNFEVVVQLSEDYVDWWVQPHSFLDAALGVAELLQVFVGQTLSSGKNRRYFFSHFILDEGVGCQEVQSPANGAGGGVVTLKHEGVHLISDLEVTKSHSILVHCSQEDI